MAYSYSFIVYAIGEMILFPIECLNTLTDDGVHTYTFSHSCDMSGIFHSVKMKENDDEQNILLINLDRIQILEFNV